MEAKIEAKCNDRTVILQQPKSVFFENAEEYRYFKLFCDKTALHLGGPVDPSLWTNLILQASERERPLRRGVIAIGALDLTSELGTCRKFEGTKQDNAEAHYQFALRQYGKFLQEMRTRSFENGLDIRTNLLASLLIFCLESYHGNYEFAASQIRTAVQLIDAWIRDQTPSKSFSRNSSPAPDVVEDTILHAFDRLEIQVIAKPERSSHENHIKLEDGEPDTLSSLPTVTLPQEFKDCAEARMYGNLQKKNLMRIMSADWIQVGNQEVVGLDYAGRLRAPPTHATLLEYKRHQENLQQWIRAFAPVFRRSRTPEGQHEFKAATLLRIHELILYMTVAQAFQTDEILWDAYYAEFVEIVHLCKIIFNQDNYAFTFNMQCILPLEFTARKCRDPLLRREALRLLIAKPRREGLWDSTMAARICAWIMGIEEEGMVDSLVPEEARVRNVRAKWDFERRIVKIWCSLPAVEGKLGALRERETEVSW